MFTQAGILFSLMNKQGTSVGRPYGEVGSAWRSPECSNYISRLMGSEQPDHKGWNADQDQEHEIDEE